MHLRWRDPPPRCQLYRQTQNEIAALVITFYLVRGKMLGRKRICHDNCPRTVEDEEYGHMKAVMGRNHSTSFLRSSGHRAASNDIPFITRY